MNESVRDEPIHEVREFRQRISERFGNDPARLVAHYMELQQRHPERLVKAKPASESTDHEAA